MRFLQYRWHSHICVVNDAIMVLLHSKDPDMNFNLVTKFNIAEIWQMSPVSDDVKNCKYVGDKYLLDC